MNTETKNDSNNNDTVEHNQSSPAPSGSPPPPVYNAQGILQPPETDASQLPSQAGIPESSAPAPAPAEATPASPSQASDSLDSQSELSNPRSKTEEGLLRSKKRTQPACHRPRNGKVAKLPADIQNFVNEHLLKNISYEYIRAQLAEKGHPGFSNSNLSRWKIGGFKEWVFNQQDLTAQEARRSYALKLAAEQGLRYDEAALQVLLQGVNEMVSTLNYTDIKAKLTDKPDQIIGLLNALGRLVTANNALERRPDKNYRLQAPGTPPPNPPAVWPRRKGGLTLEERDAAEKRMRLFE